VNQVSQKTGLTERQFYEAVHVRMRALVGPTAGDLDDLIQVAAEQAFRGIERFDGRCELRTWIYSVCYRVVLNQRRWYRRWSLRFTSLAPDDDAIDLEPSPPELLEARARSRLLYRALARMSDKYRAVVVLHDLEELTVSEIAIVVDAGELTVRSRLRDGRKQLGKLLQTAGNEAYGGSHELTPT
jgi:RNA polymerase sigma-70 factor (ECF subfamily)